MPPLVSNIADWYSYTGTFVAPPPAPDPRNVPHIASHRTLTDAYFVLMCIRFAYEYVPNNGFAYLHPLGVLVTMERQDGRKLNSSEEDISMFACDATAAGETFRNPVIYYPGENFRLKMRITSQVAPGKRVFYSFEGYHVPLASWDIFRRHCPIFDHATA